MLGRPVVRAGRPGLIGTAARTAVVAGTATAVSGRVAARQQRRAAEAAQPYEAPPPAAAPPPAPEPVAAAPSPGGPGGDSIPEQIERLAARQQQGLITAEEFTAGKQRLLGM